MNMVTEDYVSFEVAKLLKEKGFDGDCQYCYINEDDSDIKQLEVPTGYDAEIDAPTLQMAMKWLRKVHGLHIDVFVGMDESYDADGIMVEQWHFWTYYITTTEGKFVYDAYDQFDVVEHQTYEEATESAILFCLNNLI